MPSLSLRQLLGRNETSSAMSPSSSLGSIYIAGFVTAGVIILGIAFWLAFRAYTKRARAKRDEDRGAAFLSVRGLVKEGDEEKEPLPE